MILLDTHIWVKWIVNGNLDLSETIVNAMSLDSHPAVSAISCFEVSSLVKRGKLKLLSINKLSYSEAKYFERFGGRKYT